MYTCTCIAVFKFVIFRYQEILVGDYEVDSLERYKLLIK